MNEGLTEASTTKMFSQMTIKYCKDFNQCSGYSGTSKGNEEVHKQLCYVYTQNKKYFDNDSKRDRWNAWRPDEQN